MPRGIIFLSIGLVSFLISCSGGTSSPVYPPDNSGNEPVSKFINADEGGTLTGFGARVFIPPGALPADSEIKFRIIDPGATVGSKAVAGGIDLLPHTVTLNSPVLVEFPVEQGTFKSWTFPPMKYLKAGNFTNLILNNQTPSHALINEDNSKAMFATDHFSVFALLDEQAPVNANNADVIFSALERIQLRNGNNVYYDDDILDVVKIKYYLGGWPEVNGSEKWLPEIFNFAHPGQVYAPQVRYDIYRETFSDLLFYTSFSQKYFAESGMDSDPIDNLLQSVIQVFETARLDVELSSGWIQNASGTGYQEVLNNEIFDSYPLLNFITTAESERTKLIAGLLQSDNSQGNYTAELSALISSSNLKLNGVTENDYEFLIGTAAYEAFTRMNIEALDSLSANVALIDPEARTALRDALDEGYSSIFRNRTNFADAVAAHVRDNQAEIGTTGGIELSQAVALWALGHENKSFSWPMGTAVVYRYLSTSGLNNVQAENIAGRLSGLYSYGSLTYGLEQSMEPAFKWSPVVFARNLQRATLTGNLAGELFNNDQILTQDGDPGIISDYSLCALMRIDLGFLYSRLKYNSWEYIKTSQSRNAYNWLVENSPWQTSSIFIEFDSPSGSYFHTDLNRVLNESLYDDVESNLLNLGTPLPDPSELYGGPGVIIIIE
jgi:hypothetical protein